MTIDESLRWARGVLEDERVLIPRPETEAEQVGEIIRSQPELSEPQVFPDLNEKERVIAAKRKQ